MSQPSIFVESCKIIELLKPYSDSLSLLVNLQDLKKEYHLVSFMLLKENKPLPKIEKKKITITAPEELQGSKDAMDIYRVLYQEAMGIEPFLHLIEEMDFYKLFLEEAKMEFRGKKMTQEEIDEIFHPEFLKQK